MIYRYPLTILTPTYNRANTIKKLYDSLKRQTLQNFQWLVIDDGSTDSTSEFFEEIIGDERIEYYYKENGGKHTALNYAHPYIKGELICIVDSDDFLLDIAVERMLELWQNYRDSERICGMTFLRGFDKKRSVGKCLKYGSVTISNHIDYRVNAERKGDYFEILRSDIFKTIPFPEFKNERFCGESYLWNKVGFLYDTVYVDEILYICEYLEGGLTKSGRILRISAPKGGMSDCETYFIKNGDRKVKLKILIKEAWLYICYGKFAGLKLKDIIKESGRKGLLRCNAIFGLLLYVYWKRKFKI